MPTQLTANGEYATSSLSPNASLKSHGLFDDSLTSLKIHSLFTEQQHAFTPTKSAAEVTSAAHAFQISLPPQAVVFPSPSVTQSKLFNSKPHFSN